MSLPERPHDARFSELYPGLIYYGRLAGLGEWWNENGSLFTPTGVHWSDTDIELQSIGE